MGRFQPSIKAGALFPQAARTSFVEISRSRYQGMVDRFRKKKIPPPPFSLDQFRAWLIGQMGSEDGVLRCPYCQGWFTLAEVAVDHREPLSRGGSPGLDNLGLPCKADNDRKGSLNPAEYALLLQFLVDMIPMGRTDILSRLEKANKLAAGARRAQTLIAKAAKPSPPPQDEKPAKVLDPF